MSHRNGKKYLRTMAVGASLANGYWASLTQAGGRGDLMPVALAVASVLAGYFSLTWLFDGMRSK
jgi:hypothetical protein